MSNDKISLDLNPREAVGKKVIKLRASGIVPAVVYGADFAAVNVQAPQLVVNKVVRAAGTHHPVYVNVDGKARIAMIKHVDVDPVKNVVRHVSFHAVKQNEKVEANIPIQLVGEGESAAEKAGLVVLQTLETLEVSALPMNLPDRLEVSIVDLEEPGQHVSVSDITIPEGVEIDEESLSVVVASVYEPGALQAANEAAGGDAEDESEVEAENGGDEEATDGEAEAKDTKSDDAKPENKKRD